VITERILSHTTKICSCKIISNYWHVPAHQNNNNEKLHKCSNLSLEVQEQKKKKMQTIVPFGSKLEFQYEAA